MDQILFVHDGKANYPELAAYRAFFSDEFETREVDRSELVRAVGSSRAVCWFIMGFYPQRRLPFFTVHDYRSLSVAPFAATKDRVKALCNHRPDLRIFLNRAVEREMGFRDGTPSLLIDMGVPRFIREIRAKRKAATYDFAYIGEISRERGCHEMLRGFIRRFGATRSFALVGRVDESIREEFANHSTVVLMGRVSQMAALEVVARSAVAVCHVPYHRPYCFQTPTKLLEYAALGKRILINDSPSNLSTARAFGIRVFDGGRDLFAHAPPPEAIEPNDDLDAESFEWPTVLSRSGIRRFLADRTDGAAS